MCCSNFVFEQPEKQYKIVAGVIRNVGNGWELINDTAHEPIHVLSVSNNDLAITINHTFTAKQVVTMTVTPDETFVKDGIKAGASVGLDKTLVYLAHEGEKLYANPNTIISAKGNFWFYGVFEI
jgi:hypothetical protein